MYSEITADHFHNPRHGGVLADADLIGQQGTRGQGPFMVLYLRLDGELITEARFQTYGCPAAIACGSWVADWAVGKTIEEAKTLDAIQIDAGLGGLPLGKEHCPLLAAGAVQSALVQVDVKP